MLMVVVWLVLTSSEIMQYIQARTGIMIPVHGTPGTVVSSLVHSSDDSSQGSTGSNNSRSPVTSPEVAPSSVTSSPDQKDFDQQIVVGMIPHMNSQNSTTSSVVTTFTNYKNLDDSVTCHVCWSVGKQITLRKNAKYCHECRAQVSQRHKCLQCNHSVHSYWRFCCECGAEIPRGGMSPEPRAEPPSRGSSGTSNMSNLSQPSSHSSSGVSNAGSVTSKTESDSKLV